MTTPTKMKNDPNLTDLNFLMKSFVDINSGSLVTKFTATFWLALVASPIPMIIQQITDWYLSNYGYTLFVLTAIVFDYFLGTWIHGWIKRDFSIKKNVFGFIQKTSLIVIVSVIAEGFTTILGENNIIADLFVITTRLMVFIYPAGSALKSVYLITGGKFPPVGFINKISKFNKDLDVKDFLGQDAKTGEPKQETLKDFEDGEA